MPIALRDLWRRRAAVEPPPMPEPPKPAVNINPTDEHQQVYAEYRADTIARDIEQRREECREPHPEHNQIVAEAMLYAWILVRGGKWTADDIAALQQRLSGA